MDVSRAGKVHSVVIPQEYVLMQLLENVTYKESTWNANTPACRWKHVSCNHEQQISVLDWGHNGVYSYQSPELQGSFMWRYLPYSLRVFRAFRQRLCGTLSLCELPYRLRVFEIDENRHYGVLDLTSLPQAMECLHLRANQFEGNVVLTALPAKLLALDLSQNQFTGSVDLSALPRVVQRLNLSGNKLHLTPWIGKCPPEIKLE
mmetsp:Transcript_465/g.721  ORF Transcript_465/g.721 Transcript_465/m.721 type:complete len:204 (+) Transcript_465:38-649(+)